MIVGVADADFINRKNHRFPNLASMKISGFHKAQGDEVVLVETFDIDPIMFDRLYISKVFTDTYVSDWFLERSNVYYGGSGFFFDKAPSLPIEIEHCKPDYHLYDPVIQKRILSGEPRSRYAEYLDYSIGFLTRKCFRGCDFCINRNYRGVEKASPLKEFLDPDRPKISLLDDNFLGCKDWKVLLGELRETGKPFKFKQGLDERLLTPEKCELLFSSNYDGEITFAFDRIEDYELIREKLILIRGYSDKEIKFYIFTGFNPQKVTRLKYWRDDIEKIFIRIDLLSRYKALPYVMRHEDYLKSPYVGIYKTIARWCNQPGFFRNNSLNEFIDRTQKYGEKAPAKYRDQILSDWPDLDWCFNWKYNREEVDTS